MTIRTRTNKKTNVHLESLESREAPTVGLAGAWQAALAQAQGHSLRGGGLQIVQRALPVARPGLTFQGAAVHSNGTLAASGGASRAPINPTLALAQARRAAMNTVTPSLGAATFNRVSIQSALAARRSMRLSSTVSPPTTPVTPMTTPNSPNNATHANAGTTTPSLPANVAGPLNAIYQEFQKGTTVPVSDAPGSIVTDGTNVGVSVHGNGQGSFSDLVTTLQNLGMKISATDDVTWTVTGMLPIKQLAVAAQTPQTLSITPLFRPVLR